MNFGNCAVAVKDTFVPTEASTEAYVGLEHLEPNSLRIAGHGIASSAISQKLKFRKGDILFGKLRPYFRKVALARFDGVCSTDFWVVRARKGFDQNFLFYIMASQEFVDFVNQASEGTRMPRAKWSYAENFTIPDIKIEKQKEIAKILSSLDDKIELNRRMNATLEAMARALFKAWFVDFEPVHANKQNRPSTSASPEIAKLFPSDFENNIPKGWREMPLNETFEVNPLRSLKKGVNAKYLDMASVPTSGHRVSGVRDREFASGMKFENGDTLLARITPCLENGKTAFVDFLNESEIGWGSTEFIVLRPRKGLPDYFVYLLCRTEDFRNFAIQSMTGTSGRQRVQVDSLARFLLSIPSKSSTIGGEFGILIEPMVEKIKQNSEEIFYLAQIRDSLLPLLVAGKIAIQTT